MKNKTTSGKICVALGCSTTQETLDAAKLAEKEADVVEIRLDALDNIEISPFTNSLTKPLLFTNRANWEGGTFSGSEEDRVAYLKKAIDLEAAYIDIELKTVDDLKIPLIEQAKQKQSNTICSWHSFVDTPSSQALLTILQEQYRSGATIGKIVTMANNYSDVLRVLNLQINAAEMGFPLIAFCMGQAGIISRLATVELGGYMTYAAASGVAQTAPGQLEASKLAKILQELQSED